jgi:hypothetical protein
MRGKYSPTVTAAYRKDQEWFDKYSKQAEQHDHWFQYDPEGYDSYGYDENEVDRAGNEESVYYESDEFGENWRYNDALNQWGFDGVKPVNKG